MEKAEICCVWLRGPFFFFFFFYSSATNEKVREYDTRIRIARFNPGRENESRSRRRRSPFASARDGCCNIGSIPWAAPI